jgi:hypothetical protein
MVEEHSPMYTSAMPSDRGRNATALATIPAAAAAIFLLVAPVYSNGRTLIQVNGWIALLPLSFPVIVAVTALVLSRSVLARRARWLAAMVLLGFVVLTGFSIGVFYLPAAAAMVAAALLKPDRLGT